MQSGYGVPEMQQFMVDGCSLFSIAPTHDQHPLNPKQQQQQQRFSSHLQFFHHQQQQQLVVDPNPSGAAHASDRCSVIDIRGPVCNNGCRKLGDPTYSRNPTTASKEDISTPKFFEKKFSEAPDSKTTTTTTITSYRLFGELEAIYTGSSLPRNSALDLQTASSSALTNDNHTIPPEGHAFQASEKRPSEAEVIPVSKTLPRRNKKNKELVSALSTFFERLVRQVMEHQEILHAKFVEVLEKRDRERQELEDAWRSREAERLGQEAAARTRERTLASVREAAILSFLEKLTGQAPTVPLADGSGGGGGTEMTLSRRWPRAEVQALIRVRTRLEFKFREPGGKGALWEDVSATMAGLGYSRSAKRCKEKWENINKYFRKTKGNARKRPLHSKTCPYFHQLDMLYGKGKGKGGRERHDEEEDRGSDLLEAMVRPDLTLSTHEGKYKGLRLDNFRSDGMDIAESPSKQKTTTVEEVEENPEDEDDDDDYDDGDENNEEEDEEEGEKEMRYEKRLECVGEGEEKGHSLMDLVHKLAGSTSTGAMADDFSGL
ncbi:hypothetical protein AMTRI_Chr09g36020 [Amborella trichopoda]